MQNIQVNPNEVIEKAVKNSFSYEEYMLLMQKLVSEKSTTGISKTEELINYTLLNAHRMKRLNKTLLIPNDIKESVGAFTREVLWLVISESWCGDTAQTLPVIHKIASINSAIDLKIVLRDENPELMQDFLTNGALSIPKLIAIDKETNEVITTWGPRPSVATKMVMDYKEKHGKLTPEFKEELQLWFTKDKGISTMKDLLKVML
ncbi:MAG: thioredoxin family protein [Flavobacteriaceae bacterium CG_4_8_14_3_um_filter_34_10]|nr:thioredoxin family protein [Flavobacteriia bacterium]OIP51222.1 MAG: thioredoxin family protein [Flavobacteriaceae bacterium CG2_30_34_30]PIQ17421.1 MAG: thioredoxin family protein [Flavobacteriaceae bacterium CG18_big_fil_WC_8_21_14_2_50_34_36]PIV50661.1 MAG: thioredoxin family protein [Flavobacteriaceae bacterium CG02_land_8_20_14_3_00_34_13]PIX09657.1 MAG: thioredoxin family protein [Flavobacteriaceae bacterium CG_4_8_14_3_um_filter_34_10]PIZ08727.1 MAG: thioredoxin family protein [Flavo